MDTFWRCDVIMTSLKHEDDVFRLEAQFFWNPWSISVKTKLASINNSNVTLATFFDIRNRTEIIGIKFFSSSQQ